MAPPPSSKPSDAVAEAMKRRGKAPMLKLHWNPVPQERLERHVCMQLGVGYGVRYQPTVCMCTAVDVHSSVWSTPRDATASLGEEELKQLESMFAARPTTAPVAVSSGKQDSAPKKVSIIEFKRSYNVSIGLAQFKAFPTYPLIFKALYQVGKHVCRCLGATRLVLPLFPVWCGLVRPMCQLDEVRLPSEKLEQLNDVAPTDQELKEVRAYRGDQSLLGECEKWFLAAGSVSRLPAKIAAVVFTRQVL